MLEYFTCSFKLTHDGRAYSDADAKREPVFSRRAGRCDALCVILGYRMTNSEEAVLPASEPTVGRRIKAIHSLLMVGESSSMESIIHSALSATS